MAQQQTVTRDISMALQMGSMAVSINAEGVSWNPTIARDMQDRMMSMLREMLQEANTFGLLQTVTEVTFDEGEYAETGEEGEDG